MDDENIVLPIKFYRTDSGREPVRDWLRTLAVEDRKRLGEDLKTVQFGWPLGMPLVRKLGTGLWEVRSIMQDGIARILFTVISGRMVLLHGFVKKSQKTPQSDLDLARQRLHHAQKDDADDE